LEARQVASKRCQIGVFMAFSGLVCLGIVSGPARRLISIASGPGEPRDEAGDGEGCGRPDRRVQVAGRQ
jgi:hypothetical protein